jgi:type II secretory pathway pseudopilin PulG
MAVLMTVAMPAWKQAAQREKEEELVFRGEQYARAIGLFQRKYANASPPSLDVLVDQRFLRKKYKDPMTNDDFQLLTQAAPGQLNAPAQSSASPGQTATSPLSATASSGGRGATSPFAAGPAAGAPGAGGGGIIGVTSKSKDKSIRLYKGRNHYNEWAFVYTQQTQAPGAGAPGAAAPGQRGGPGQQTPTGSPFGPGVGPGRGDRGRGNGSSQPFNPNQPPTGPNRGRGPGRD